MIRNVTQEIIDHLKKTSAQMKIDAAGIPDEDINTKDYREMQMLVNTFSDVIIELAEENLNLKKQFKMTRAYNSPI